MRWVQFLLLAVGLVMSVALPGLPLTASAQQQPAEAQVTLHIDGMTCASCSVAVRTALRRLEGVRRAEVNVEEKRARVTYEPQRVTPEQMVQAIERLGYRARVEGESRP